MILADEPTANLDSKIGHEIARLLRHAATDEHRSVAIVSHDTRLTDIADRVLWLEDGQFKAMSELATDPVCGMSVEPLRHAPLPPRRDHLVLLLAGVPRGVRCGPRRLARARPTATG